MSTQAVVQHVTGKHIGTWCLVSSTLHRQESCFSTNKQCAKGRLYALDLAPSNSIPHQQHCTGIGVKLDESFNMFYGVYYWLIVQVQAATGLGGTAEAT